jgi:para-nitrobenzyl esterase
LHRSTGDSRVYRYYYAHPRPAMRPEQGNATPGLAGGVVRNQNPAPPAPPAKGAVHSAEIEYALGNLATNNVYAWTEDDYKVSKVMQDYFANFIKKRDPNGPGLPTWPANTARQGDSQVMRLDVVSAAGKDQHHARYLLLDQLAKKP